jgi:hypothetical protein
MPIGACGVRQLADNHRSWDPVTEMAIYRRSTRSDGNRDPQSGLELQ